MESKPSPCVILLVEDNPGDVRLTTEALKGAGVVCSISVVRDGVEAMAFLRGEGEYADAPRPDLILLDLNLPRKDGREVLAELKQDPDLKAIPVIVLTTSDAEQDILTAYGLHANAYITKPDDLPGFEEFAAAIQKFWFGTTRLPPRDRRDL